MTTAADVRARLLRAAVGFIVLTGCATRSAPPPADNILFDKVMEVGRVMNLSEVYEDRTEGIFVWRVSVGGLPEDCHALFAWYIKRVGENIALYDPGFLHCTKTKQTVACAPCAEFSLRVRSIQEEFKRRWLDLVGPMKFVGPSIATHAPEAIVEAFRRAEAAPP